VVVELVELRNISFLLQFDLASLLEGGRANAG